MMFQSGLNDQAIKEKDNKIDSLQRGYAIAYRDQQDSSTKAIQDGINSGNRKTYDTIAFVFKQQGLNFDSLKLSLVKLKDSLERVTDKINIKSINKPQLTLAPSESGTVATFYVTGESDKKMNVKLTSENNTSFNVSIRYYVIPCSMKKPYLKYKSISDSGNLISLRKVFTQNRTSTASFDIKPEFFNLECSIILLVGTFSADRENKDRIKFENAICYNFKNNSISSIDDQTTDEIIDDLKRRKFIK